MPASIRPTTAPSDCLRKIISGGQTGVDRGALDAALAAGFPCGGSCPRGRRAEDGRIPSRYPLVELSDTDYRHRTRKNVADADGTLVISFGEPTGGTRETVRIARELKKPLFVIDGSVVEPASAADTAAHFVRHHAIAVLNVAGPRESNWSGAHRYAASTVEALLACQRTGSGSFQ